MKYTPPLPQLALCALLGVTAQADDFTALRRQMVSEIQQDVHATSAYIGRDTLNVRVMEVMASVPRHEFVRPREQSRAYENRPLPIGHGQTISQPYIVALMTDLMDVGSDDTVLEVGTGSGYQAAVLARLVRQVYTIEIIEPLAVQAETRFETMGYANVTTRHADGYYGWEEHAPFDAIIVTATSSRIPPPLVAQLKNGGRMIIPVGPPTSQELLVVERDPDGELHARALLPVAFVPLLAGTATQ